MKYKARIDIRVEDNKFNLSHVKAGGTLSATGAFKADWLLSKDQEKHWFVSGELGKDWGQLYIEFMAGGRGATLLEFRGDYFDDLDVNRHEIWLDDVALEGGKLYNSSFEDTDDSGNVKAWAGVKTISPCHMRARTGKRCILVWHDEPVVQKVFLEAGKRYKLSAWFKPNVI